MEANQEENTRFKFGLLGGMGIVVGITTVLVIISFTIFLNSGAYLTVKQISTANKVLKDESLEGLDTSSPIQTSEIRLFSDSLPQRVKALNDSEDFRIDIISSEALGGY
jgi:hypothetical protein